MKKLLTYFAFVVLSHSLLSATPACISTSSLQLEMTSQFQDASGKDLMDGSENNTATYPMDIFSIRFN